MAKKKKNKKKVDSYDHMQGSPMDVANHPAMSLPDPAGGAMGGPGMGMGGGMPNMPPPM